MKAAESDQPKKAKTNKLNPWAGTPMQLGLEKKFGTKVSIKGSKETWPHRNRLQIRR